MSGARITRKDVESVFATYAEVANEHGLVTPGRELVLSIGSKTYGNAYAIHERSPESGGLSEPMIGRSFLGMTASEAYTILSERLRTVGDLVRCRSFRSQ